MKKHLIPRTELSEVLFSFRKTFYQLGAFSLVINLLGIMPSIYMLQVYDRVLASSNETTLLMLTLMTLGLYVLMELLEFTRSSVLIRVGNKLDMLLNQRVFTAAFERNLKRTGGNPSQAIHDLTNVRQFLTGNGLFAFLLRFIVDMKFKGRDTIYFDSTSERACRDSAKYALVRQC